MEVCALRLRSDRNYDALSAFPMKEEFAALQQDKSTLPKSLQFVSLQSFCDFYLGSGLE